MIDIIERLKALWKRFRFWLIVLLGGFTEQTIKKEFITYRTIPYRVSPLRAEVRIGGVDYLYARSHGENLEEYAKRRLCDSFADQLTKSDALNLTEQLFPESMVKVFTAEIYVVRSDAFQRLRHPEREFAEEVRHAE